MKLLSNTEYDRDIPSIKFISDMAQLAFNISPDKTPTLIVCPGQWEDIIKTIDRPYNIDSPYEFQAVIKIGFFGRIVYIVADDMVRYGKCFIKE